MGIRGSALVMFATVVLMGQERSSHWIPHVTHDQGPFRTMFLVSNPTNELASWHFDAYDQFGTPSGQWTVDLAAHETRIMPSHELFQGQPVSHFVFEAPSIQTFRQAFFTGEPSTRDGFLFKSQVPRRKFIVPRLPRPDEFLGLALVNTGTQSTPIRAHALDINGKLLNTEILVNSLPVHAKALTLLEGSWLEGADQVVIDAEERIALTAVIGPSNHDIPFLTPVNMVSLPGVPDNAIEVPDPNFHAYLVYKFGNLIDADGFLTPDEATIITEINCRRFGIRSLEGISHFPNLEILDCSENDLESLPDLSNLRNLRTLKCASNRLTKLPSLAMQIQLEEIHASSNQLSSLPNLNLPNLTRLNLTANRLKYLPELDHLNLLQRLWLSKNHLESLPDVASLVSLQYLQADYNHLHLLPDMSSLSSLEWLDLRDNQLTAVEGLSNLAKLEYIDLSHNEFQIMPDLPDSVLRVRACCNKLVDLSNLENRPLPELLWLDLSQNSLSNLHPLASLKEVQELFLEDNWISNLTPVLNLRKLGYLYVSDNVLDEIDCPSILSLERRLHKLVFNPQRDGTELDCGNE